MPVVRNSQFYFKKGICWSDVSSEFIKCRKNNKSIYDVKSMSLFSNTFLVNDKFIISLINSNFIGKYIKHFINSTVSFQINDARQIPIVIPTKQQLLDFENIFDKAYVLQQKKFQSLISESQAKEQLAYIQEILDSKVLALYEISKNQEA